MNRLGVCKLNDRRGVEARPNPKTLRQMLVVCRSGASTVSELAAVGSAAILVPFPAAVDDHQTHNAEFLVSAGAALRIQERDLSAQRLADVLSKLTREECQRMAQAARKSG